MTDALAHRGPDGKDHWINDEATVGLGSRRLAIIDLTEAANQPMHYLDRYTILFNGAIYNYLEIKEELIKKRYSFTSKSDTEVILAAYDHYGHDCLKLFDGMFALAILDKNTKTIFFARDRFGEKPLFYYNDGNQFLFASEMKALWAAGVEKKFNYSLLLNYLALGYVKNPADNSETFYTGVSSLPASSSMVLDTSKFDLKILSYWSIYAEDISTNEEENIAHFNQLLTTSVKRRMRSDVKLGTSLSGGIDSTSIVATIKKIFPVKDYPETFSAVFPGYEKNESKYIEVVRRHYQVPNHQVEARSEDLIRDFEKLCYHQEEPFQSSSIYAQFRVFELAATFNVKVLLDGQGADEILAGYYKYIHWHLQGLLRQKHFSEARKERIALDRNGISFKWGWQNYAAAYLPNEASAQLQKREIKKIFSNLQIEKEFVKNHFDRHSIHKPVISGLNDILYYNTFQSGLEELLRYADRNSMAHGREVRLPFLSHELVRFVFSLPPFYKIKDGWTKWLLRKTMEKEMPAEIVWRKDKVGFEPPQRSWMEDPMFSDYLYEAKKRLVQRNILRSEVLNKKNQPMDAHAADNLDWRYLVAGSLLK